MADSSTPVNIENLVALFKQKDHENSNQISVKSEHHNEWIENSMSFRQLNEDISKLPTRSKIEKEIPSESDINVSKASDKSSDEKLSHEIKLYSAAQFRSHINRLYPFHLDYFSDKLSALDFEQHRMGLYIFYDINNGYLINNLEKESNKKTNRGKNMKRMNGLLLNEHRMFNQCAKEYAIQHLTRDYEFIKSTIDQFMKTWLQRKTDRLVKRTSLLEQYYSQHMSIPLNSYDSLTPIPLVNLSTVLRLGTVPLLSFPENIEQMKTKCSDDRDRIVTNRFNPDYRLTNLVDDPNLLCILSQDPSIDVVLSKSSFHLLIELFSTSSPSSLSMTLPIFIREFQFETVLTSSTSDPIKKKIIFIDKPLRQRVYTKRELNEKYFQRAFRSLLLSTTGGKRETTDNQFNYTSFNNKTEFEITEIKIKTNENKLNKQIEEEPNKQIINDNDEDDDDDEDENPMIISTDGDTEQQQILFNKSKQKVIHSAPILQERETNNPEDNVETGPVPVVTGVKFATPIQGNYEYCLWQLGTLKLLIRSSYHGYCHHILPDNKTNDELITCYSKLEYQPQFGLEQITDKEYRRIWFESYLRQGASVILGRINVFTQTLLKSEKMTYENIDQNLKECQIDMIKPITKVYGLLYGLQSLETNKYLLSCNLNDDKIHLYKTTSKESNEKIFDLHSEPFESNELLVESNQSSVPWIPLTPTLLLPYHIDFERIPLTFCPRNKRCYDISITIPAGRQRRNIVIGKSESKQNLKKRKRLKKKTAQQRKKKNIEQSKT